MDFCTRSVPISAPRKTPEMVRKELWGHLLVYNVVRGLMAQAARASGLQPREVSFKGALQTFNAFWPLLKVARTEAEALRLWVVMIWAMGQHEVGDRPDRYEPRAHSRGVPGCGRSSSRPNPAEPGSWSMPRRKR